MSNEKVLSGELREIDGCVVKMLYEDEAKLVYVNNDGEIFFQMKADKRATVKMGQSDDVSFCIIVQNGGIMTPSQEVLGRSFVIVTPE